MDILSRTAGPGRRAQGERAGTVRRDPACRGPSCFCHAVAPAVAVIRDVHLVADFRLVRPLVEFSVRDEDTFGAVAFSFFQGIRQVNVPAADSGLVLSGEGRGSDANDFHVASCLSSLTGAEGPPPKYNLTAGHGLSDCPFSIYNLPLFPFGKLVYRRAHSY